MPESYVEALYQYQAIEKNQISFLPHERIQVLERDDSGWWIGRNSHGALGIFPSTYVKEIRNEKVFNRPKEMKPLPAVPAAPGLLDPRSPKSASSSSSKPLSREARLANDLGIDFEEAPEEEDGAPARRDGPEVQRLAGQVEEVRGRLAAAEAAQKEAAARIRELEEEAAECRKKEELTRTQLNVVKRGNIVLHETNRRLGQEVSDLRAELEAEGRVPPEVRYECTADEAIERFLASAVGTLRQEHEDLRRKCEALGKERTPAAAAASVEDGAAAAAQEKDAEAAGGEDGEEVERLRAKYKKLEKEYKLLRKEHKELKAQGTPASPTPDPGTASATEDHAATIQRLQEELAAARASVAAAPPPASAKDDVEELRAKLLKLDKKRKGEIAQLTEALEKAKADLATATQALEEEVQARAALAAREGTTHAELEALREARRQAEARAEAVAREKQAEVEELLKKYRREEKLRRQLFNELQELKGNIRVFCRLKPYRPEEADAGGGIATTPADDVTVKVNDEVTGKQHAFEFDVVYGPTASQSDIFTDVKPLATSVLDGYNACIFAYGQTGSGKTYTMEGPPDDRGVNFRTMEELFAMIAARQGEYTTEVRIAVIEVYNEQIYDLLGNRSKLEVRYTEKLGVQVPDMVVCPCSSQQDVVDALYRGYDCRKTASTNMNEHSSRSHCVLTIVVTSTNVTTGVQTRGKLHLVDLAGSERMTRTGASDKERVDEAKSINSSLTHLGLVINSLANKREHIPYRNSALTKLLQDSLGGNCKCLMFANVSMLGCNAAETVSTLKFACNARQVELGKAEANKVKKKRPEDPTSPVE